MGEGQTPAGIRSTTTNDGGCLMDTRASLIVLSLLASAGCAGGQGAADYGTASPQREAADQRTDYRTQANSLRDG